MLLQTIRPLPSEFVRQYLEMFQSRVDSFMATKRSLLKACDRLRVVLILCGELLIMSIIPSVSEAFDATIRHLLFQLRFEYRCVVVPGWKRTIDPNNLVVPQSHSNFICEPSAIRLLAVPFSTWVGPRLPDFAMDTVDTDCKTLLKLWIFWVIEPFDLNDERKHKRRLDIIASLNIKICFIVEYLFCFQGLNAPGVIIYPSKRRLFGAAECRQFFRRRIFLQVVERL